MTRKKPSALERLPAPSPIGARSRLAAKSSSTKGCTARSSTNKVNIAQYADLKIGVVPVINLEWIQKIHRDKAARGYSTEAVTDTILRRMPDYVNYICPQFVETDINFQRVPTVDTSNPFIARWIPTPDESMVVIRFRQSARHRFSVSAVDDRGQLHVARQFDRHSAAASSISRMQLILTPMILQLVERTRRGARLEIVTGMVRR